MPATHWSYPSTSASGYDYTCARTTDFGVTWTTDAACGPSVSSPVYFDDREYIWVDRTPSSPFYGRVYVTTAYFDAGGTALQHRLQPLVQRQRRELEPAQHRPPRSGAQQRVRDRRCAQRIPSLGISANGTLGYAWRRGLCCGGSPTVGTNDKVMFARSTDGGVTFPFSNTIVTVPWPTRPSSSTRPRPSASAGATRRTSRPTRSPTAPSTPSGPSTARPTPPASAAIYLSKTTDNGVTWSTPVIPYNNPNANIFQGFGWVKVTADHTVHVTYFGGTTTNTPAPSSMCSPPMAADLDRTVPVEHDQPDHQRLRLARPTMRRWT